MHNVTVWDVDVLLEPMRFEIWGLSGTLHTQHAHQMPYAQERLWHWINAFDVACNRFRTDSEICHLNAQSGHPVAISETLEIAIGAALEAASATNGLCDPTILPALLALGYDRDFDDLVAKGTGSPGDAVPAPGLSSIQLDREHHMVQLAPRCQIDLGASAKALIVDLVADDIAPSGGVIVELGGDVAVHGNSSEGPWAIGVSDSLMLTGMEPRISLTHGGVATSSTTARAWRAGDRIVHHIIDPRTGTSAVSPYATVSVSATSCVMANAFATAGLLWGEDAGHHIAQAGWSARLVRHDGTREFVGGWPHEREVHA